MLAYCGIDCTKCLAYRGTTESDTNLLEEAARTFANGAYDARDWVCLGCQPANQQFIARFCAGCDVRKCAAERGVQNCAACDDFEGCTILSESIADDEGLILRMKLLRGRFIDSRAAASRSRESNLRRKVPY